MLLINILVIVFEVIYYGLFMKFTKGEGKLSRYLLLFTLISVIGLMIGTNNLMSYMYLILMILLGLRFIVKVKTSLFDLFVAIFMMFIKVIMELLGLVIFYAGLNSYISAMIFIMLSKIVLVVLLRDKLNVIYAKLKKLWDENAFGLRYICMCSLYLFVIVVVIMFMFLS